MRPGRVAARCGLEQITFPKLNLYKCIHICSNLVAIKSSTELMLIIIIIMIISIFKEDSVFSITAILPYGPPVNTDIDCYQTFSFFVNVAMLVV